MMDRRDFLQSNRCGAVLATPALLRSAFADEVSSIVLVSQHGLPYLPLMVMDEFKLIEKHAESSASNRSSRTTRPWAARNR